METDHHPDVIGGTMPELSRETGILEFQDAPEENLEKLKTALMDKKRMTG
jgi:hypothetical protein